MENKAQIKRALLLVVICLTLLVISIVYKPENVENIASTESTTETVTEEVITEEIVTEESSEVEEIATEIVIEEIVVEQTEPEYQEPFVEVESEKEEIVLLPPEVESEIVDAENSLPEIEQDETEIEETEDEAAHYIPIPEEWNLIVVNRWNKIPENHVIELTELSNGQKVDSRISEALQEMFDDAAAIRIFLKVREGYRTTEQQQSLFDEKVQSYIELGYSQTNAEKKAKEWVAVPGTSEHELGLAVDINADQTGGYNLTAYAWLADNAHKYGFILRYPSGKEDVTGIQHEPWHFRYVGEEVALEIYEREICLEEYLLSR